MADGPIANPGTTASCVVRLTSSSSSPDIPNNRSYLAVDLHIGVTAANGAGGPVDSNNWSTANISSSLGNMGDWQGHYDLRPASSLPFLHLLHWEGWVTHDANGSKSVSLSGSFSGQGGTPLGVGSVGYTHVLPNLPRYGAEDWGGSSWGDDYVERWSGSAWVLQTTEIWNGSAWVRQG